MLDYSNKNHKEQIRNIVSNIVKENPELNNKDLYKEIRKTCNIDKDNIYLLVKEAREHVEEIETIIDELGNHKIVFNGESTSFDINFVDIMFLYYSKHGYDLSGEEMQQFFWLTAEDWLSFKRQFNLYKDSHVVSDWSIKNLPKEKIDVALFRASNAHADRVRDKMIITHNVLEKRELLNLRKKNGNADFTFKTLQGYIDSYKPQTLQQRPVNSEKKYIYDTEVFAITDFHIGKIGTNDIIKRIDRVCNDIWSSSTDEQHLFILWDIVESLVPGGMHPWQEWAQEVKWFELWKLAVDNIDKLVKSSHNLHVHMMAWNHGRVTQVNMWKHDWLGELSIYETVKRMNPDVDITIYNDYVEKIEIDGVQYIFSHGENWFDKEAPEKLAWKYKADPNKPLVIIYWHLHHIMASESKWVTKVWLPALAGTWDFDSKIRVFSEPWYVKFSRTFSTIDNIPKVNFTLVRL